MLEVHRSGVPSPEIDLTKLSVNCNLPVSSYQSRCTFLISRKRGGQVIEDTSGGVSAIELDEYKLDDSSKVSDYGLAPIIGSASAPNRLIATVPLKSLMLAKSLKKLMLTELVS
ncbi:hypothetical protein HID58_096209 [Brassica napus]|uniref:Uncharacterized protein n=1 Tax=Brassica napus TaxID=3708 RepID=A0ABQ7X1H4_BRANA|nr:hypothetical protein HID58_096209 [Brassica napus]